AMLMIGAPTHKLRTGCDFRRGETNSGNNARSTHSRSRWVTPREHHSNNRTRRRARDGLLMSGHDHETRRRVKHSARVIETEFMDKSSLSTRKEPRTQEVSVRQ